MPSSNLVENPGNLVNSRYLRDNFGDLEKAFFLIFEV